MLFIDCCVIGTSGLAAAIDLRTRKIPNWLTLTVAVLGIILSLSFWGWYGGLESIKGWLVGMAIFFIPFIFGGMGGGDVKLMGAIGALAGVSFVLKAAILAALWGGLMALLVILIKRRRNILNKFWTGIKLFILTNRQAGKEFFTPNEDAPENEKLYVPYGVAIFLGVISAYLVDLKILG